MNDNISIDNKDILISYLESGCKPVQQWRIGVEHEKFGFIVCDDGLKPMSYKGPYGIEQILKNLSQDPSMKAIYDKGNIVGLLNEENMSSVTLEPAGQLELSGAPLQSISQVEQELNHHIELLQSIRGSSKMFGFTPMGYVPKWSIDDIHYMPKSRYEIMRKYMQKVGSRGLHMMHMTSTVQVNLDYESEQDMRDKMYASTVLQPVVTALFANSPIRNGEISNYQSLRGWCWLDTDNQRSGLLSMALDKSISFEKYTDYILDVPMYFIYRDGVYHDVSGKSFVDYMKKGFPNLRDICPTLEDWKNHLTTAFPEVRLKRFIEMRGADAGDKDMLCALPALWVGALYDKSALSELVALADTIDIADLISARSDIVVNALQAKIGKRIVQDIARDMVDIANKGLKNQAKTDGYHDKEDVSRFIQVLYEITETGITRAQRMIEEFKTLNYDTDALMQAHDILDSDGIKKSEI